MILCADARAIPLRDATVQCCVTSPPYWGLRDYGTPGQLGLEKTPEEYVANMVDVFREVRRVLKGDGVLWLNLGDSYSAQPGQRKETDKAGEKQQTKRGSTGSPSRCVAGLKPKDLVGIPWRVAFALQADGWYLRSDIIWSKPNPMPESVTDRPTKAHEYIFLMSKGPRYYYNAEAVAECQLGPAGPPRKDVGGSDGYIDLGMNHGRAENRADGLRNRRTVWSIATQPYSGSHFATFPEEIPRLCILAGSRPGDVILDPFGGSGTTRKVALEQGRKCVHLDISYHDLAKERGMVTPAMAGLL